MSKPAPLQYNTTYHIYNRGNNGETIFRCKENYLHFLKLYIKHFHPYTDTYAYCLLPNHFHIMPHIKDEAAVAAALQKAQTLRVSETLRVLEQPPTPSQAFGNLCNAYTKAYNKRYHRTGSLFENPFERKPVTNDRYFTTLIRYIHQNPQTHGIVDDFRDWPYSSYDAILHDKPTRVAKTAVVDWFSSTAEFADAHQTAPDMEWIASFLGDEQTLRVFRDP